MELSSGINTGSDHPLSLLEVRTRLLDGSESDLQVVQGDVQALESSREFVIRYYRKHIERISYQGSLDLIESRDRISPRLCQSISGELN